MNKTIPSFLEHLKVYRGFPVPWFVAYVDGKPDFRMIDPKKMQYALEQDKCFVCGKKHIKGLYFFITGPMGLANGVHSDCPLHLDCAKYSLQICPHLFFERTQRNETGDLYKYVSATTGQAGIKEKPSELYLIKANKYKTIPGPEGGRLIKFNVVDFEEFWYENGILIKKGTFKT